MLLSCPASTPLLAGWLPSGSARRRRRRRRGCLLPVRLTMAAASWKVGGGDQDSLGFELYPWSISTIHVYMYV